MQSASVTPRQNLTSKATVSHSKLSASTQNVSPSSKLSTIVKTNTQWRKLIGSLGNKKEDSPTKKALHESIAAFTSPKETTKIKLSSSNNISRFSSFKEKNDKKNELEPGLVKSSRFKETCLYKESLSPKWQKLSDTLQKDKTYQTNPGKIEGKLKNYFFSDFKNLKESGQNSSNFEEEGLYQEREKSTQSKYSQEFSLLASRIDKLAQQFNAKREKEEDSPRLTKGEDFYSSSNI